MLKEVTAHRLTNLRSRVRILPLFQERENVKTSVCFKQVFSVQSNIQKSCEEHNFRVALHFMDTPALPTNNRKDCQSMKLKTL